MISSVGGSVVAGEAVRTSGRRIDADAKDWPRWVPLLAGLLTTCVAISGTTASLSADEVATYSAAVARPLSGLWGLVQQIDGHFLPYYLLIHVWSWLGEAEWWLRLPSALAAGVAAGFLADLGRRLAGPRAGVLAAALFAVLPSVSYHGANARPYAFAAAAAVVSAWALHRVAEAPTGSRVRWYAASVALLGCTHLFSVLVLPAQFLAALLVLPRRTFLTRIIPATAVGCVPLAVLALVGWGERHAISWIQPHELDVLLKFPKHAAGSDLAGPPLFALAVVGVVILLRRSVPWGVLAGGWLVLPPVLLLAIDELVTPAYVDRYVFVAAPALALAGGVALASVRLAPVPFALVGVPVVLAVALLGLPDQADYRQRNGHYDDFPGALGVIQARERPGDAIVYGQSRLRTGFVYYGREGLPEDVLLRGRGPAFEYAERDDLTEALAGHRRVWVVWRGTKQAGLTGKKIAKVAAVRAAGYRLSTAWHSAELPGLTVALFERGRGKG
ncbi:glycosyltransferase family 39 protein [Microbispora camponoti]|uniref:Glycosyltransferase family 39 protein n=1 Tax=Microbispora bryophytorum subsp. camponoti TaxID=1677852 RepID=A0ABR8L7T2_9ACTN|nr:glycosyltransferase family 39 protein [Microbispora camponoti]